MDVARSKKIATRLTILWLVSFILIGLIAVIYQWSMMIKAGESQQNLFSASHLITTALVVFYFLPLLLAIRHHAKIAHMKTTRIITLLFIIHHFFWLALNIIISVYMIINS